MRAKADQCCIATELLSAQLTDACSHPYEPMEPCRTFVPVGLVPPMLCASAAYKRSLDGVRDNVWPPTVRRRRTPAEASVEKASPIDVLP